MSKTVLYMIRAFVRTDPFHAPILVLSSDREHQIWQAHWQDSDPNGHQYVHAPVSDSRASIEGLSFCVMSVRGWGNQAWCVLPEPKGL